MAASLRAHGTYVRPIRLNVLTPEMTPGPIGVYRLYSRGRVVYVGRSARGLYERIRNAAKWIRHRHGVEATSCSFCAMPNAWEAYWEELAQFERWPNLLNKILPARPAGAERTCQRRQDCGGRRPRTPGLRSRHSSRR